MKNMELNAKKFRKIQVKNTLYNNMVCMCDIAYFTKPQCIYICDMRERVWHHKKIYIHTHIYLYIYIIYIYIQSPPL